MLDCSVLHAHGGLVEAVFICRLIVVIMPWVLGSSKSEP